jgi:hypothetical protein
MSLPSVVITTPLELLAKEVVTEQVRAISNGKATHDDIQGVDRWVAKLTESLGGVAQFRRQPVTYRIHLVQLASLTLAAMAAYDRVRERDERVYGVGDAPTP